MTSDSAAEISRLHSELRSVKSDISDLTRHVGKVSRFEDRLRTVEQAVETMPAALRELAREQKATHDLLTRLVETYQRNSTVQTAHNELAVAERQWEAEFGQFKDARTMAASIVDVVASGHLDRSVIVQVTTELAIKSPRYWVAQATLAVAFWLDDKPQQHRQALDYALRLDPERTSLFMALLLRDQDRDEELQEWLAAYLSRLTPANLPGHFQVVIDAATGKAFGDGAAPRLVERVAEWYTDEAARQDVSDAAVGDWKLRLVNLGARHGDQPGFPRLAANTAAWKLLSPRHKASLAIEQAARYFRARFETGAVMSNDVRKQLAELLDSLARTEDPREEELCRVIREKQFITRAEGDVEAARAMVVAYEEARSRTLNIAEMVSRSAFPTPDGSQPTAPTVTELLAIMLSKGLIVRAAEELRDDLPIVGDVVLAVGERSWQCRFECDSAAKSTRPALHEQAEEQSRTICAQIQRDADQRQGRLRWLKWGCPGGLVAAVGLAGAGFVPPDPHALVFAGFVVAVPSILGMNRLPKVIRRAASQTEREKRDVIDQINAAADELADLWDADRVGLQIHLPKLRRYLGGLTADSLKAATRSAPDIPLPKTREFPAWTPRPPRQHPAIEGEDELSSSSSLHD